MEEILVLDYNLYEKDRKRAYHIVEYVRFFYNLSIEMEAKFWLIRYLKIILRI